MPHGKRGKHLEELIIQANRVYDTKGWALVHKMPTPWTVDYNPRTGKVYKAFPREKSTVDYEGVSHGKSLAFEAKSTNERTRFPLANIKQHQINYLLKHQDQGGLSFFIIEFAKYSEHYFVPFESVYEWWEDQFKGGRKSIPHKWFVLNCDLIKSENGALLHYLKHCDTVYKKKHG